MLPSQCHYAELNSAVQFEARPSRPRPQPGTGRAGTIPPLPSPRPSPPFPEKVGTSRLLPAPGFGIACIARAARHHRAAKGRTSHDRRAEPHHPQRHRGCPQPRHPDLGERRAPPPERRQGVGLRCGLPARRRDLGGAAPPRRRMGVPGRPPGSLLRGLPRHRHGSGHRPRGPQGARSTPPPRRTA